MVYFFDRFLLDYENIFDFFSFFIFHFFFFFFFFLFPISSSSSSFSSTYKISSKLTHNDLKAKLVRKFFSHSPSSSSCAIKPFSHSPSSFSSAILFLWKPKKKILVYLGILFPLRLEFYFEYLCDIPDLTDCPHRPTRVFPACFILTRTLLEKTSRGVTHPGIAPGQARLTLKFPRLSYRKEDASC